MRIILDDADNLQQCWKLREEGVKKMLENIKSLGQEKITAELIMCGSEKIMVSLINDLLGEILKIIMKSCSEAEITSIFKYNGGKLIVINTER